jgi:TonB family protein
MNEPASDTIAARSRAQGTLMPTLVWSVAGHVAIVAAIWLAPARTPNDSNRLVMNVTLGGAPGPRSGGLTQTGGRRVEPTPEPPKPTPRTAPTPPPSRSAAAALPAKTAPARPERQEPSRSTPAIPEPPRDGSTRTETSARGQGFGLATGGNGQKAIETETTGDFCCPGYLEAVRIAVERAWVRVPGAFGSTTMRFRIQRNGTIDSISMVQSSNNQQIDAAAMRAVTLVPIVPPLPAEYTGSTLALRMRFENR